MANVQIKLVKRQDKQSIVLAYTIDGKRKQSATGLYLLNGNDAETKRVNKLTLQQAEKMRAQQELTLAENKVSVKIPKLLDYFQTILDRRRHAGQLRYNSVIIWRNSLRHLRNYLSAIDKTNVLLNEVTVSMVEDFKQFLSHDNQRTDKKISNTTINIVVGKLHCVLSQALIEDYCKMSVVHSCSRVKEEKPQVQYLSTQQIDALADTPCVMDTLRLSFLYSCQTGIRISDTYQLKWSNIDLEDRVMRITTVKTQTPMEQPLTDKAIAILNEAKQLWNDDEGYVFGQWRKQRDQFRRRLIKWFHDAGIPNEIRPHFHIARDSFANNLLNRNVDIRTVSVLLTHASIRTTERNYVAPMMLDNKREALSKL